MNTYRPSTHERNHAPSPARLYVVRRLASAALAVAAIGGIAVASLLDGAGVPAAIALAIGTALFVTLAVVTTRIVVDAKVGSDVEDRGTADRQVAAASEARVGWGASSQLGRDPEVVIGRQTGVRA